MWKDPYKRFYPGAQGEIGEGRKEIRGELGAGSELPGRNRFLSGRKPGNSLLGSVNSVDFQADDLIDREILHPARLQVPDIFRRDAVNAHRHQLVHARGIPE